jgi:hypothetical protein
MVGATAKPTGPPQQQPAPKVRPPSAQREGGASRGGKLGPALKILISVWIVFHFTAIFLAALSIGVSSPLVIDIAQRPPVQWYLDALYLNQGHSFFAPEVGPGHLIRYELFDGRGQVLEQGELPNRKEHWPRLRYHRHFMLADQAVQPGDEKIAQMWQRKYLETYARHVLRMNENAASVRVRRFAHWPLPRSLALQQRKLDDREGYEMLMEVTQRRSDIAPQAQMQPWTGQGGQYGTAGRWTGAPR